MTMAGYSAYWYTPSVIFDEWRSIPLKKAVCLIGSDYDFWFKIES